MEALHDPDGNLAFEAAYSLGLLGTPAVEPLIYDLQNEDAPIRSLAAYALGEAGDERAVEPQIHVRCR
jgi:HEAT repeat protein